MSSMFNKSPGSGAARSPIKSDVPYWVYELESDSADQTRVHSSMAEVRLSQTNSHVVNPSQTHRVGSTGEGQVSKCTRTVPKVAETKSLRWVRSRDRVCIEQSPHHVISYSSLIRVESDSQSQLSTQVKKERLTRHITNTSPYGLLHLLLQRGS